MRYMVVCYDVAVNTFVIDNCQVFKYIKKTGVKIYTVHV